MRKTETCTRQSNGNWTLKSYNAVGNVIKVMHKKIKNFFRENKEENKETKEKMNSKSKHGNAYAKSMPLQF